MIFLFFFLKAFSLKPPRAICSRGQLEGPQAAKHEGSRRCLSIWGFIGLRVNLHCIIQNRAIGPNSPANLIRH